MSFNWINLLKNLAPDIASAFIPGSSLLGKGVKFLSETFLGKPDGTESEVAEYVAQNAFKPEFQVKLAEVNNTFKIKMAEIGYDTEKLIQENVTSRHATDMNSDNKLSKNVRPITLICLMSLHIILMLSSINIDLSTETMGMVKTNKELLETVFMFYFGGRSIEKIGSEISKVWKKKKESK